jgi:hypothetical protein
MRKRFHAKEGQFFRGFDARMYVSGWSWERDAPTSLGQ